MPERCTCSRVSILTIRISKGAPGFLSTARSVLCLRFCAVHASAFDTSTMTLGIDTDIAVAMHLAITTAGYRDPVCDDQGTCYTDNPLYRFLLDTVKECMSDGFCLLLLTSWSWMRRKVCGPHTSIVASQQQLVEGCASCRHLSVSVFLQTIYSLASSESWQELLAQVVRLLSCVVSAYLDAGLWELLWRKVPFAQLATGI